MILRCISWVRQNILIRVQLFLPDSIIYSVHHDDHVGEIGISIEEFRKWASSQPEVYSNNLAAVRWRLEDGERQLELGSWAYRPNGRFSNFQYHMVPIRNKNDNIELYCHREHNPLRHPFKHLKSGNFWGPDGVKFANNIDFS